MSMDNHLKGMSDLTYSWQYYVYNIVSGAYFKGDLTGDEAQITLGLRSWAQVSPALGEGMTISYAFGTGHPGPVYFDDMDGIGDFIEEPMSAELRAIARKVFDDISSFTNLTFVEVSSRAGRP